VKNISILVKRVFWLLIAVLATSATVHADENPAPADPSLLPVFEQFGGKQGLDALMEDFMIKLIEDPRTREYFAEADQKHIKAMLSEQFCVILGGPCTYSGKGMKEAHAKLAINRGGFNALVEDLQLAMDMHKVPFRAQNKLLAKLAPMHREVVTQP
jgi:hemoglobin